MRKKAAIAFILLFIGFYSATSFVQLRKVRVAIPTLDIITLPLKMAQARSW